MPPSAHSPAPRPGELRRARARRRGRIAGIAVLVAAAGVVAAVLIVESARASARAQAEQRIAARFALAWRRRDYAGMYALLSPAARRRVTPRAFRADYRRAARTATATAVDPGAAPQPHDGRVRLPVRVRTRAFGTVAGTVSLPLAGDGRDARIDWGPPLAFPGLRPGEHLRRTLVPVARGAILAADGTRLSAASDGSAPLGDAGLQIAGRTQRASRAQREAGRSVVGASGLERVYDDRLAGHAGGTLAAGARVLASRAPVRGQDVRTTVSPRLQRAAAQALGSRFGGVAVLDPHSGAVLALSGIAISAPQPPGSTFKIITTTAALESAVTKVGATFPVQTSTTLSGVTLSNAGGEACGGTLEHAFAVSCNSVFAPLGAKLGARRLVAAAEQFGFNQPSRLPDAARSSIPPASEIGDDLAVGSSAIGQGKVQTTPLEMATVAATIANHGVRADPRLLASLPVKTRSVTTPRVAGELRRFMLAVVREGTGTAAAIPGQQIAGKTGTAELRSQNGQPSSDPKDSDAWFVAFAPAYHPKVVVAVLLVGAGAGGDTAAPVARQVLEAALRR